MEEDLSIFVVLLEIAPLPSTKKNCVITCGYLKKIKIRIGASK